MFMGSDAGGAMGQFPIRSTPMHWRLFAAALAVLGSVTPLLAQSPNFSGQWKLDERASRFTAPAFSGGRGRRRRMEGPVIDLLNYKDVSTLSQFMTEQGKILPKRTTKVTARFQRQLGRAIKRARYLSLIPYLRDHEV